MLAGSSLKCIHPKGEVPKFLSWLHGEAYGPFSEKSFYMHKIEHKGIQKNLITLKGNNPNNYDTVCAYSHIWQDLEASQINAVIQSNDKHPEYFLEMCNYYNAIWK